MPTDPPKRKVSIRGANNPNWKGGKSVTHHGYLRITAGPDRGKLEHRAVVERCLQEWNPWGFTGIPAGWHVHHTDFDKQHNCPSNLLLLPQAIHQYFIDHQPRYANGYFGTPRWQNPQMALDRAARSSELLSQAPPATETDDSNDLPDWVTS